VEPVSERVDVEPIDRCRLTDPGRVWHDQVMVFRQAGDDRRPVGASAFDAAVQQDERRTLAGFEHRGCDAVEVKLALRDGKPGEHALPSVC
jgi:hypothetical protein